MTLPLRDIVAVALRHRRIGRPWLPVPTEAKLAEMAARAEGLDDPQEILKRLAQACFEYENTASVLAGVFE